MILPRTPPALDVDDWNTVKNAPITDMRNPKIAAAFSHKGAVAPKRFIAMMGIANSTM